MKISNIEVTLLGHYGTDLEVVNAARVSFDKQSFWGNEENWLEFDEKLTLLEKDKKLIDYLARHNHKSPFNHAFLSFRVKAPIFVARQLVKHEYLPWNEVSRRYVSEEPEFWFPKIWRQASADVKQGSSDESVDILINHGTQGKNGVEDPFYDAVEIALDAYHHMLDRGVCAEQARMVLPQNVMTTWIWSGTLFAFVKMCRLRLHHHAQQETREVAEKVALYIEELFPVSYKALMKYSENSNDGATT